MLFTVRVNLSVFLLLAFSNSVKKQLATIVRENSLPRSNEVAV